MQYYTVKKKEFSHVNPELLLNHMSSHISTIVEPMNKILAVNPKYKSTGKVKKWCSSKGITKTTWVDSNVSSNPIIGGWETNR